MKIIGITGTIGAGKGTVVKYLVENYGFVHFSVRSFITEEINKRGLNVDRDSLTFVANDLRTQFGPSYIVDRLYERAVKENKNCIIESIRTPGEILSLRKNDNFKLLAVDADPRVRYQRVKIRNSETDHVSYETFLSNEKREYDSDDPNKQNLSKCIQMADFHLNNDGSIEDLNNQIERLMKDFKDSDKTNHVSYKRPTWDEYFLEVADIVAKRATCDRGRSGCVIAKDHRILVTGYVGSPAGLSHCDDVGHLMKAVIHEDGSKTMHCMRTVHAEQNALCQAAKIGIPLDGSTLYCRMTPCRTCAMLIINCGIIRVVCEKRYHVASESEAMFKEAEVELVYVSEDIMKYENQ